MPPTPGTRAASREVEHVPQMGGPQIGVLGKALQHVLVVHALVFLGVVAAAGTGGVEVGHGLTAVFGVAQRPVGVDLVKEVHPQVVEEQPRHVPAQIQVPAHHVGDVGGLVEGPAHGVAGQGGEPGGVQLVVQVVECPVVVQQEDLGGRGEGVRVLRQGVCDGQRVSERASAVG